MAILGHFWAFLAFRKSKNTVPAFVCIPLCLLSVSNQGGKPSIAFLRNFEWQLELQKTNGGPVLAKGEKMHSGQGWVHKSLSEIIFDLTIGFPTLKLV